jgi:hypothetical protein
MHLEVRILQRVHSNKPALVAEREALFGAAIAARVPGAAIIAAI